MMTPSLKESLRTSLTLFAFALVFTSLMAGVYQWTRPGILAEERQSQLQQLQALLPQGSFNNNPVDDTLSLPPTPELGLTEPSTVYRARQNQQPAALLLEVVAPNGYAGKIKLLVCVLADGKLGGVRVISHHETPGLGDYIEWGKEYISGGEKKQNWIDQFRGKSLTQPRPEAWKVKKDGGEFDAMAGATISPRAVTAAVQRALIYSQSHAQTLYAPALTPTAARSQP